MGIREIQIRDYIEQFYGVYPELRKFNDKICFMYAGALQSLSFENYTTHKLAKKINLSLAKGKTKLVFLNLDETIFSRTINQIHTVLDIINIDTCDIFYVCSGATSDVEYLKYVKKNKFNKQINILALNKFERCIGQFFNIDYEVKLKSKLFLCFNRVARPQRILLLSKMLKNKLLDRCYYSFLETLEEHRITNAIRHREDIDSFLKENIKFPLLLNRTIDVNPCDIYEDDLIYFQDSYLSIVTETMFFGSNDARNETTKIESIFFSEKIFKPITVKHPFILVSLPHSLYFLRTMGYKTFHPYIDESYDNIKNDEDRMNAIEKELIRLSNFNDAEWIEFQKAIKPIVEHNYNLYIEHYKRGPTSCRITTNIESRFAN